MEETLEAEPIKQRPSPTPSPAGATTGRGLFTATELAAAAQLVQLSESSGDSTFFSPTAEEDRNSSSSPRSVGTRPPPPESVILENEEEETGPRRSAQRYRSIAELYAVAAPLVHGSSKKKKRGR